ncbi:TPA: hypothetical protein QDB64_002279 [Burkholderia multivorans]|nr:hypothetical protein [Burkholderia multivorans]
MHGGQFPGAGIFFGESVKCDYLRLRMSRQVVRLRADACARVACDVAAQVAARHGLPVGRCGGRRLMRQRISMILAAWRLRAIVGVDGSRQHHGNDNAACDEQ